jgi:hypothetical protein
MPSKNGNLEAEKHCTFGLKDKNCFDNIAVPPQPWRNVPVKPVVGKTVVGNTKALWEIEC